MERGFLSSRGRKNNRRKKTDIVTGTGSVMESDWTPDDATPLVESIEKEETPSTGNAHGKSSYANVTSKPIRKKLHFRILFTLRGNGIDVVVPVNSIKTISERFVNTAYGFFLGKRVAYPVVANYVRNTWGKYGLVRSMFSSSTGLFSFQFSSMEGLNAMLENGSWFIRNNPLILKKWHPDVNLLKEDEECPKNIGTGEMKNLKKTSQTPKGFSVGQKMRFKPKQVYQPVSKKPTANSSVNKKKDVYPTKEVSVSNPFDVLTSVENDVKLGTNEGTSNLASQATNSSGSSFWNVNAITFVDDDGKPLKNVASSSDYDREDEVASVDNDMAKEDGYGTQSLLEQWPDTYENDDYG
nr:hypothetical protein [Tanacetum cinerariifolium]